MTNTTVAIRSHVHICECGFPNCLGLQKWALGGGGGKGLRALGGGWCLRALRGGRGLRALHTEVTVVMPGCIYL